MFLTVLAQARPVQGLPDVSVCVNPGGNASSVLRAEAMTSQIYEEIGVNLVWRTPTAHSTSSCILITLSERTPEEERPGALGYAQPYGAGQIVVFVDRVRTRAWPSLTTTLLAHVFAHEIGHILQGLESHSETGIMKARWVYSDYRSMALNELCFTPGDIEMIRHGLEVRISRDVHAAPNAEGGADGL